MERKILVERKKLVARLAELTGKKAKYLGVATQSYEIGNLIVTKEGILVFEEYTDAIKTVEEEGLIEKPADGKGEDKLSISMPKSMYSDAALNNLYALISSKGELLKHAFGVDELKLEIDEEKVTFGWFKSIDQDHTNAYMLFVKAISDMAINQSKISDKPGSFDNEKYAFRCFLLRLGFIGKNYKGVRKVLLENLSGSSAFKNGKKEAE